MTKEGRIRGWGLIGPGRFAREFAAELGKNPRVRCRAVASRSLEKAEVFAREFGFERAYGSYRELIDDPGVEVVYVVLPHVFHADVAREALEAGKAVLCEKPLTASLSETRELISVARSTGSFLMEAMKTGFLPAIHRAREWMEEGAIGEIRMLRADFCFRGPEDPGDRLMNPALGGGCLLDVGIYPLYLARHFLGEIRSLEAVGSLTETGVEDTVGMLTRHADGGMGNLAASFRSAEAMSAEVLGSEGRIEIPRFHAADRAFLVRNDGEGEEFRDRAGGMVTPEIEAMLDALDAGHSECPGHTLDDTLELAAWVEEAIRAVRTG